jgi:hypothetical protein
MVQVKNYKFRCTDPTAFNMVDSNGKLLKSYEKVNVDNIVENEAGNCRYVKGMLSKIATPVVGVGKGVSIGARDLVKKVPVRDIAKGVGYAAEGAINFFSGR